MNRATLVLFVFNCNSGYNSNMAKIGEITGSLFTIKQSRSLIIIHDFFEKTGGAEIVLKTILSEIRPRKIYFFTIKSSMLKQWKGILEKVNYKLLIPKWLLNLYRKVPKVGKLFFPYINLIASKRIQKLDKGNIFINTSSFMPTSNIKATIYYHIFPTWYLTSLKTYFSNIPFFIKFIYNLFMVPYQKRIFSILNSNLKSIRILTNSTFTAYMFYKFWQVHTHVFLPVFIYKNENSDFTQVTQSTSTLSNKSCYAYIGRLDKGKRLEQLVEALPSNKCLLLIGAGELESKLKDLSLELGKQVIFQGWVEHDKLPQYLKEIKGFINLNYEPFGLTFFETLSYNKPVLGSIFSGLYDIAKINIHFIQYIEDMPLCKQLRQLEKLPRFDYNTIKEKLIKSFKLN